MKDYYSNLFFENLNSEIRYKVAAKFFAYNLSKKLKNIDSIVDVGGGTGLNVSYFDTSCKVCIDGSENAQKHSLVDFYLYDLRVSFPKDIFPFNKRYDLVICVEVAEHIDKKYEDIFLRNITSLGDMVFFTAAIPGQEGLFHKNLQPREYWIEKFKEYNYKEDYNFSVKLKDRMIYHKNIPWWFKFTSLYLFSRGGYNE